MPQLTRAPSRSGSARSRLLLVRPPARSVRRGDEPDPLPMRLALGVIVALGVVGCVWIIGHLGYRLGFGSLVRVPDLAGEPGGGLVTGTMIIISVPREIFHAGLHQPMWLMVGFALIAVPAAGLAAARPLTPGGPRLKTSIVAMANTGAVLSMISCAGLIWWTGSRLRSGMMGELPLDAAAAGPWINELHVVAGMDVLAVVGASLWIVLVFRLPIVTWLRVIAACCAFFTLVVVTVAMAVSNGAAAQLGMGRAVTLLDDDRANAHLILGTTPHHTATLVVDGDRVLVELRSYPDSMSVTGRMSVAEYLAQK